MVKKEKNRQMKFSREERLESKACRFIEDDHSSIAFHSPWKHYAYTTYQFLKFYIIKRLKSLKAHMNVRLDLDWHAE